VKVAKNATGIYRTLQEDYEEGTMSRTQVCVRVECFQDGRDPDDLKN
jgi:hypothetical protein